MRPCRSRSKTASSESLLPNEIEPLEVPSVADCRRSTSVVDAQDEDYKKQVLPADVVARVVIEAGVTETWWRFAGPGGRVIGIDRFGESAPAGELFEHFGFSVDNVVATAKELLGN